ncbi:hypothetical protein MBLNU459_g4528t2 [Dothideomycetes sp. NU459]
MSQVPDRVLQWLYNALLNPHMPIALHENRWTNTTLCQDYRDPQRTYADTASVLSAYQSLAPRTDVYTYNTGQSALLLCLSGTLPVNFRGTVYRFPLTVWIPHAYPHDQEGVMVFVNPGDGMAIRPGQHIGVDGRVYHPYLRDWITRERSNLVDFFRVLQDVFAREPPVVSRQQQQQTGQSQMHSQRPAPPPKERSGSAQFVQSAQPVEMPVPNVGGSAPPRPPKPGEETRNLAPVQAQQQQSRRAEDGPPVPPLPHQRSRGYQSPQLQQGNGLATLPRQGSITETQPYPNNNNAPPIPPLPYDNRRRDYQTGTVNSPVSPLSSSGQAEASYSRYTQAPPFHLPTRQDSLRQAPQQMPYPSSNVQDPRQYQAMPYQQTQQQQQQPHLFQAAQMHSQQPQQLQQAPYTQSAKPVAPVPDLLTDPFDISLPTTATQSGPPPPIPPNPEREQLLSMLSSTLVNQIQQKVAQNESALAPLRAQSQALQEAHNRLTSELHQLQHLDSTLASNEQILHRSLHDCDTVIESWKSTPAPPIDEVLVAPTVVAQQLWNVQADEAAIREALWCLQRAVGAGRVGGRRLQKAWAWTLGPQWEEEEEEEEEDVDDDDDDDDGDDDDKHPTQTTPTTPTTTATMSHAPQLRSLYRRLLRELPPRETSRTLLSHPSILQQQIRTQLVSPSSSSSSPSSSANPSPPQPTSSFSKAVLQDPVSTTAKLAASALGAGAVAETETASEAEAETDAETEAEANGLRTAELEQFVQYVRAQRVYATLLERYNPGMNMDEEERVRLTARRVGMDLPVEWEK